MYRFKTVFLLLAVLLSGCYRAPVEPLLTGGEADKWLLDEEKMVVILVDVHLAEGLLINEPNARHKDSLAALYYGQIFRHHGIDSLQFNHTMQRYMQNPQLLHALYERVLQQIQVGEQAAKGGER